MSRLFGAAPAAIVVILSLCVFWAGCSNEETPVDVTPPSDVDLLSIICNPLAPEPGETALLTVQGTGSGGIGTYQWQVSGGTIVQNGTINVSWETPDEGGIYRVFVKATVGAATDTASTYILLRRTEAVPTGLRYSLYPNIIDGELYFVGSPLSPSDRSFYGYHAYRQVESAVQITSNTEPRIDGGFDFVFSEEGLLSSVAINAADYIRQQALNVVVFPLIAGTKRFVSNNDFTGFTRKNQHTRPDATSDLGMFVWQFRKIGPSEDGTRDQVNIAFRGGMLPIDQIKVLTTAKDSVPEPDGAVTFRRNIRPFFTQDDESILYFAERSGWFEPCIIPIIEGNEPDTASSRLISVFRTAGVKITDKTVFEWNPIAPTQLGFIDTQGRFCIFDHAAETVEVLATGVLAFAWSADGKLAGVAADGVYVLEPGQTVGRRIFTKERSSDDCIGVNWSPGTDNQRVGFRLSRKGASSRESFSAFVIYSLDDDRWYYASRRIASVSDPDVIFPWMRVTFDSFGGGMYAPVPVPTGGGQVVLYYTY